MKRIHEIVNKKGTAYVLMTLWSSSICAEESRPIDQLKKVNKYVESWLKKKGPVPKITKKFPVMRSIWHSVIKRPDSDLKHGTIGRAFREQAPPPFQIGRSLAHRLGPQHNQQFLLGMALSDHLIGPACPAHSCSVARFLQQASSLQVPQITQPIDFSHYRDSYLDGLQAKGAINALALSLAWSRIQPNGPEQYDQSTLDRYADLFCSLIQRGITPIICFHYYDEPCWFADRGSFENTDNIAHFTNYCRTTYQHIMHRMAQDSASRTALEKLAGRPPLWASFNGPEEYATRAYIEYTLPPANSQKNGTEWYCRVLKNMCQAHVEMYAALKSVHEQEKISVPAPRIGLFKHVCQRDPAHGTVPERLWNISSRLSCGIQCLLYDELLFSFFTSGKFTIRIPGIVHVKYENAQAPQSLDFIGVNYYSHRQLYGGNIVHDEPEEKISDHPLECIYPEGLYRGLRTVAQNLAQPLAIPIYVTANGVATDDENKRNLFYQRHLHALLLATQRGYDIRGYFAWTIADGQNWPAQDVTKPLHYGLYTANPKNPEQLEVKDGAQAYIDFAKGFAHALRESENRHT